MVSLSAFMPARVWVPFNPMVLATDAMGVNEVDHGGWGIAATLASKEDLDQLFDVAGSPGYTVIRPDGDVSRLRDPNKELRRAVPCSSVPRQFTDESVTTWTPLCSGTGLGETTSRWARVVLVLRVWTGSCVTRPITTLECFRLWITVLGPVPLQKGARSRQLSTTCAGGVPPFASVPAPSFCYLGLKPAACRRTGFLVCYDQAGSNLGSCPGREN